jgi:hypothetical protein
MLLTCPAPEHRHWSTVCAGVRSANVLSLPLQEGLFPTCVLPGLRCCYCRKLLFAVIVVMFNTNVELQ